MVETMTARERTILGKLCFWKDTRTTYTAEGLAELIGSRPASVVASLRRLRDAELVRYYPGEGRGHAGLWAATKAGREEVARDGA